MLVDCPKCGFNQPEDRYCAQCGVDIENFRKKSQPFWLTLSDRPAFHVAMATILAALLFVWIYVSQKQDIDETIRQAFTAVSPTPTVEVTSAPAAPQAIRLAATPTAAEPQAETAAAVVAETAAPVAAKVARISYAEVPRALVSAWISEGQILNETANSRSVLLNGVGEMERFRREDLNLFRLPGGKAIRLVANAIVRDTYRSGESESGFTLEFVLRNATPTETAFDVQISAGVPTALDDSNVSTITTTGGYTVPTGHTLIILGTIPQQSLRSEAARAFANSPFQILQSAEYLSGASEFAIFIQPE